MKFVGVLAGDRHRDNTNSLASGWKQARHPTSLGPVEEHLRLTPDHRKATPSTRAVDNHGGDISRQSPASSKLWWCRINLVGRCSGRHSTESIGFLYV